MAYLLGCALTTFFTLMSNPFFASMPQLIVTGVLVIAAVTAAFIFPRDFPRRLTSRNAPPPWLVGCVAVGLASAFTALPYASSASIPAWLLLIGLLACGVAAGVLIARWSSAHTWSPSHYLALATGTVLTYAWSGLNAFIVRGATKLGAPVDAADIVGQCVLILVVLGLIGWAVRRNRTCWSNALVHEGAARSQSPFAA